MNEISKKLSSSVDEAVDRLVSELSFIEKTMIVNTSEEELIDLQFSLGEYIRKEFRLDKNNTLMESCRSVSKVDDINIGHASFTIITALWKKLQKTFLIKDVK